MEALAAVLQPKPELLAATQPMRRRRTAPDWRRGSWLAMPAAALVGLLILFVILPNLTRHATPPALPGPSPSISTVVACPPVSPEPQIAPDLNPAPDGSAVTFTATGFDPNLPMFIFIDPVGDCNNPTAGTQVYAGPHPDPFTTDAYTLPATLHPGSYQLRACTHIGVGSAPTPCVQVPFYIYAAAAASPSPAVSPAESPSAAPSQ